MNYDVQNNWAPFWREVQSEAVLKFIKQISPICVPCVFHWHDIFSSNLSI